MNPTLSAAATRADLAPLFRKSMLLTTDWTRGELDSLLALARRFHELDRARKLRTLLPDELGYALFFDNSTRTKSAWAGAAARLGMRPVIVDGGSTQVEHGETAEETGAMLGMNAHALGVRHDKILGEGQAFLRDVKRGIDDYLAATGDPRTVPVVNLQCDVDHPTQTMADLLWMLEKSPQGLAGKKVGVTWAYSPSYAKPLSVPQGLVTLLTRYGAHVTFAHPDGYPLVEERTDLARQYARESGGSFTITDSMDAAFTGADFVYPKSWGPLALMTERVAASRSGNKELMKDIERRALARNAHHRDWICDERRMALTANGAATYMHCLPADIGDEVTPGVMHKARTDVARQANYKLYVIMALIAAAKIEDLPRRLEEMAS